MKKSIKVLGFSLFILVTSCSKTEKTTQLTKPIVDIENNTVQENSIIKQNIFYKGKKYLLTGTLDAEKKGIRYESVPNELLEWNKNGDEAVVSHVLLYEDRTDIYLFDTKEEHAEAFQFEDGKESRLKGYGQATLKTYQDVSFSNVSNISATNYSVILRQISNTIYKTFDFNSVGWNQYAYGQSIDWVGSNENDEISGIQLNSSFGSERVHFMACVDANYQGARLYITKLYSGVAYTDMFRYTYSINIWFTTWQKNWNDEISSYEFFQTNVKLYNNQI